MSEQSSSPPAQKGSTPESAERSSSSKKRKGSLKGCFHSLFRISGVLLLILFAFLVAAVLWLNGPGFRWLAEKYGPDYLARQGYNASFEVSGNLWSGPKIDSITLTSGIHSLRRLEAENLQLRYNVFDLKNKKLIESLTADRLTLEMDYDYPKKVEEEEPPPEPEEPGKPLRETLAEYRAMVIPPEIKIAELNLHFHKGEQNYYQIKNGSLHHEANAPELIFGFGTVTDFQDTSFSPETATITWRDEDFLLNQIPIAAEMALEDLELVADPFLADGEISLFGSRLVLDSDFKKRITLKLTEENLDLAPILEFVPQLTDTKGTIEELDLVWTGSDQPFDQWDLDLILAVRNGRYEGEDFPPLRIKLNKDNDHLETHLQIQGSDAAASQEIITLNTTFTGDTKSDVGSAWKNSTTDGELEIASLDQFFPAFADLLALPPLPDGYPSGAAHLSTTASLANGELAESHLLFNFKDLNWAEAQFQEGSLRIDIENLDSSLEAKLQITQDRDSSISSFASYSLSDKTYSANFKAAKVQADTLKPFLRLSAGVYPIDGIISLDWKGSGSLEDLPSNTGSLSISQTRVQLEEQAPIQVELRAKYNGLNNIDLQTLSVEQLDQRLQTRIKWDGQRIDIPNLSLIKSEQELIKGTATLPFTLDTKMEDYFSLTEPWDVDLIVDRCNVPATAALLGIPIPDNFDSDVALRLLVGGSPAEPSLSGRLLIENFILPQVPELPRTTARLAWGTTGSILSVDGSLEPEGRNPITITGNTNFYPKKWAETPESFLTETFTAKVIAPEIRLEPFADLSPTINRIEGALKIELHADGTFQTPNITGDVNLDMPQGRFNIPRYSKVRKTSLAARFADNQISISPFITSTDGAIFTLDGTIGIADTSNPTFDLRLLADKALAWRNDNINSRLDADITLRGTLEDATLAGNLDVVESIFYKDIEILPLNVPVSIPKAPSLPSLHRKKPKTNQDRIPIPPPYGLWKVDLKATTKDPFLVRGNLTTGKVTGTVIARGTLANPRLKGEMTIEELEAALPFSTLSLQGGKAVFTPEGGFIPQLQIRAQSRIPPYDVDLFIADKASSPTLTFASNPPLPENEIMTLLATGTTTEALEDSDAATGKAFQLLIEQIRRSPPGSPLHPLAKFAEPLKDVEIQVAGADPFTGKRRNTVTLPIPSSDHWFISASVDAESNTRGLVLYILKFR